MHVIVLGIDPGVANTGYGIVAHDRGRLVALDGGVIETAAGTDGRVAELFPDGTYADVPGLCKVGTLAEIEAQGWSLNPGRYVRTAAVGEDDGDFALKLAELHDEFTVLSDEAELLRRKVDAAVRGILEA